MLTKEDAEALTSGIMAMDWSRIDPKSLSAFAKALDKLRAIRFGTASTPVTFKYDAPMVLLTAAEARGILDHMQLWAAGEVLLSRKLHGEAQGYCFALSMLARDAEAEFSRGFRVQRVKE